MNQKNHYGFEKETLLKVLNRVLCQDILDATFEMHQLKGGTVGEVWLVYGTALTVEENKESFKVVYKRQKKWERFGDLGSWRREYDLYQSDLSGFFNDFMSWPKCYGAYLLDAETQLWMEYVEGLSGENMTSEMYVQVANEMGCFQGRLHATSPEKLNLPENLSDKGFSKRNYLHYRSWSEVYDYIRQDDCEVPRYLCEMLIKLDEEAEKIWTGIETLPLVFCHRDLWVANIFCTEKKISLIDWDTAGWGYLGEDIASLITDEGDVAHMVEHAKACIKSYYEGFSKYVDISQIKKSYLKELILFLFGYRLISGVKFAETKEEKTYHLDILNKIYQMEEL